VNQITAAFIKGFKDNINDKLSLFWVIAWPLIWLFMGVFIFLRMVPEQYQALARGQNTISMITFSVMIAGMSSLTANIVEDRQRGLFLKLKSMPVQPWKDSVGRILAILLFCFISMSILITVGLILGARFEISLLGILKSLGFLSLSILASSGIGLIIGSLVRNVQGAIMTGVSIAVITSALSGVFFDYSMLPEALRRFAQLWPISAANSLIQHSIAGFTGYAPTNLNIILVVVISLSFFAAGLIIYNRFCWRSE
jgi:ABC-2 type transport system permease protein